MIQNIYLTAVVFSVVSCIVTLFFSLYHSNSDGWLVSYTINMVVFAIIVVSGIIWKIWT